MKLNLSTLLGPSEENYGKTSEGKVTWKGKHYKHTLAAVRVVKGGNVTVTDKLENNTEHDADIKVTVSYEVEEVV